ncbi:putative g2 m transition checkpoint protein sum2 [Diplodia seriata]|uniref:Putative g2 m transition checkpoint protein sum2 n=1 Tax=Diplodia seriata TaxID=420778 RepID=A0A0G2DRV5_9PEZI|nr:putative g2 m transition checkpoint protein sum2 [Diplodia seriata]
MHVGPPGQGPKPGPPGPGKEQGPVEADAAPKSAEEKSKSSTPAPAPGPAPTPPVDSKPDTAAALAPAQPNASAVPPTGPKAAPTGPKNGRIVPVVPLATPGQKAAAPAAAPQAAQAPQQGANPPQQYRDATQAATAAVAAAMAKLKPQSGAPPVQGGDAAITNLTQKVAEMRADDRARHGKPPGVGGFPQRGGRGGRRGSGRDQHSKPFEVPGTDFDFEGSNAKFNKQDLVKEAIATGSPLGTPGEEIEELNGALNGATNGAAVAEKEPVVIPAASYNRSSSFFDNISSELKDREEARGKLGGHEFRTEERRKNLETFGQGSVDNYRGGYRGRGRGRGFGRARGGFRARGGGAARGRGGHAPAAAEAGAL